MGDAVEAYFEATGDAIGRRRMADLNRGLQSSGLTYPSQGWTTGWVSTPSGRRTWVYRGPAPCPPRLRSVEQAVEHARREHARREHAEAVVPASQGVPAIPPEVARVLRDTQAALREQGRHNSEMENTLRLNRKRIQHLEEVVVATTRKCEGFQDMWKHEQQRAAFVRRKFGEDGLAPLSPADLDAVARTCVARGAEAEAELARRRAIEEAAAGMDVCYICRGGGGDECSPSPRSSSCARCSNSWCDQCALRIDRCPFCLAVF